MGRARPPPTSSKTLLKLLSALRLIRRMFGGREPPIQQRSCDPPTSDDDTAHLSIICGPQSRGRKTDRGSGGSVGVSDGPGVGFSGGYDAQSDAPSAEASP